MSLKELEAKLADLSIDSERNNNLFSECRTERIEVVEHSPFSLDLELAGGSRPRYSPY